MKRNLRRLLVTLLLSGVAGIALVLFRAADPVYAVQEWLYRERFHRYDDLIREIAAQHEVEPTLIKALVWRESRFSPEKVGKDGERGLMQILPTTAEDWAKAVKHAAFHPDELFDARTNLEAGTWHLKQAIVHWSDRDDPVTFALAEYNAGRTRAHRWSEQTRMGRNVGAEDFLAAISFPATRDYVDSILAREKFYRERGRL